MEHDYDDSTRERKADRVERRSESVDQATQRALADRGAAPWDANRLSSLQRAAGNAGVAGLVEDDASESVQSTISGGGRALDEDTQQQMERQLGADFSSVRVHSGPTAQRSAEAVAAKAYTVGENVVLGDSIDTASDAGQRTLAHELTHVIQQREGPVDGTESGGVKVSDPNDRFEREAEATADAVMAGNGPGVQRDGGADHVAAPLQREEMPEEEELQMQRQEEEEEEVQMQRQEEEEELQMQRQEEEEELMQ